ncbi:MAG: T9SS type A sorting domain-containing protein, partial [Bacteroidetes bacterium]|nr:T9SS type A sorting domain-containing protein [Bacteroidota bacterium]
SAVSGSITVKGNNSCGDGAFSSLSIIVNPLPIAVGTISGLSTVCQGQSSVTYTVPSINNATSYVWILPTGATGTSSTNSIIVNYGTSAVSGSITVNGNNSCGDGTSSSLSITVNPLPVAAGTISGLSNVCQGQSSVTYTVPVISNATSYVWTLPTGASGTSSTNSITVNYGTSAVSGSITVKGNNSCGDGVSSSLSIIVNPLPVAAESISGLSTVCQGQSSVTYTVPAISNATSYVWTLPSGASGISSTNSITINYGTSAVSGSITVKGNNNCGDGVSSSLSVTVNPLPVAAGTISGLTTVCQEQSSVTYTVPAISYATSYVWILPTGANGTSSANSITVNYGTSAVSGSITVKGNNSCGDGASSSLSVTVNPLPAAAGTITGLDTICQGQNNVVYNVPSISNATSYLWELLIGTSGTSLTNSIIVDFSTSTVSGIITVKGYNSCGEGVSSSFPVIVNPLPIAPGIITGSDTVMQGQNNVNYTVASDTSLTSYTWTLPSGASIVSGLNTNSITVNYSNTAVSGNISVSGNNYCGIGAASSKAVFVIPLPCTQPTIQATLFTSSVLENDSLKIGWTRGNGDSVLVVARKGDAVNADPMRGISYFPDSFFGNGSYTGTGNFVVYKGTGTSVKISGLMFGTTYHFAVYEYNATSTCYKIPALTGMGVTINYSIFTEAISNAWENSANWSDGIPDSITNVIIPSNKFAVVNSSNHKCRNLTIAPLGKLTINNGKSLDIKGNFLIRSDVTGTGSLIHYNTGVNATVQRYISHNNADEFHMLASPVAAQAIAPDFNAPDGFFVWNEPTANWIEYAEATFAATNGGAYFVPGKGYAVSYPNITTKNFYGELNQGVFNIPITYTAGTYSGWNFVANPYPSAIDWAANSGWNRNVLSHKDSSAIWIWNAGLGNYGTYINSNSPDFTNNVSNYIPVSQGFWVNATTQGMLSMTDAVRVHSSQTFLKSSQSVSNRIRLNVTSTVNTYSDEIIIKFGNENDFGGAEKMFSIESSAPSLYSIKLDRNWSINYLSSIDQHSVVPLGFKAGVDGDYLISALGVQPLGNVMLEDLKTGTQQNLSVNSNYSFNAQTNDDPNRFLLHFTSTGINEAVDKTPNIYYSNQTIHVYNPWQDKTTLNVYDVNGRLIQSFDAKAGNNNYILPISQGVYFVKLVDQHKVFVKKEVVY